MWAASRPARDGGDATDRPRVVATAVAFVGLFLGSAAVGSGLARILAPGSWLAEAVSFFALPLAFAAGLQLWYGLALFSLVPRLVRAFLRSDGAAPVPTSSPTTALVGSWVFLPMSSGLGAVAGLVVGLASPTQSLWIVFPVYWLVGTLHGALAWRLARAGILMPPEAT
jgi:hypothetical protein